MAVQATASRSVTATIWLGHPTALTYPNGHSVVRGYDAAGRLTPISAWLGKTTTISPVADGNPTSETDGNGVTAVSIFDAVDQLCRYRRPRTAGLSPIHDFAVAYFARMDQALQSKGYGLGSGIGAFFSGWSKCYWVDPFCGYAKQLGDWYYGALYDQGEADFAYQVGMIVFTNTKL